MHYPKKWHEYLEVENGEVYRVLTAEWKDYFFDCYKENGNGEHFCRNVYYSSWGGYCVAFPGEPYYKYNKDHIAIEHEWGKCTPIRLGTTREPRENEKRLLSETYPGFNYVLAKWKNATLSQIMHVLPFWKEHKEVEFLCAAGYWEIATKKMFYKLSDKKRNEIIKWISKHKDYKTLNLKQIQEILKYKLTIDDFEKLQELRTQCYDNTITYLLAKYLEKQATKTNESIALLNKTYKDYIYMARNLDKNLKSDYWRYPSDLNKAHKKVLEEKEIKRKIKELNKIKEKQGVIVKLEKLAINLEKFNAKIDGYLIYFSGKLEDWDKQAEELHQCIIASDYISKMVKNQCRIAFIRKDNIPIATVEIKEDNRIGQFYANELDRSNCLPSDEVTQAVNKWISGLPILIKSKEKKCA